MVLSDFLLIHLQCTLYSVNIFPKSHHIILNLKGVFIRLFYEHLLKTLINFYKGFVWVASSKTQI